MDPGTASGAVVVCTRFDSELKLTRNVEVEPKRGQSSVGAFMSAARELHGAVPSDIEWRRAVIEFPSGVHMGRGNTATMLKVCRVAAEVATRIQRDLDMPGRFFDANDLRRRGSGHVISNDDRPHIFERVYGIDPEGLSEHEIDAALFVAKTEGVL